MCGISGFFTANHASAGHLAVMNRALRHRGPDDEGYGLFSGVAAPILAGGADTPDASWHADTSFRPTIRIEDIAETPVNCALGHRRLSIVDLSPLGHQPMPYAGDRYWITYNGEIYNYIELRAELEGLGHKFISHSDTEVILAAYAQWGPECLARFNGMWAFAIYDRETQSLFLARDRFGVKPLYYWVAPDATLYFASEIKAFASLPGWHARVNGQRAYDFLVWAIIDHTDETLFAGVYQFSPGHYALIDNKTALSSDDRISTTQWYQLKAQPFAGSFDQAAAEFESRLRDAVRLRLRADVPVGSCLSGGLDSTSIVCLMNGLLRDSGAQNRQKTFSARAGGTRVDESKWIDLVVDATGVDAYAVEPSLDRLFSINPHLTWHQDEPFGSTSIYAQYHVFKLAHENGVTVMLDGQGADEQLAGYHSFFAPRFAGLLRKGRLLTLAKEIQAVSQRHGYSPRRAAEHIANMLLPGRIKTILRRLTGRIHSHADWIDINRLGAYPQDPYAALGNYTASVSALAHAQLTRSNLQMLLHWEDRDSMAHSIESRVPFLDYRLVEFVLGLPDDYKLAGGITKRVLREGMSGIIPDAIRDRTDKIGFATPEESWMRENEPALFRGKLEHAIASSSGILKPSLLGVFDDIVAGRKPFSFLPWRAISFAQWLETFSVDCTV